LIIGLQVQNEYDKSITVFNLVRIIYPGSYYRIIERRKIYGQ